MQKSLDTKLAEIRKNPATRAFIIADAKDPDMARGIQSFGPVMRSDPRAGARRALKSPEAFRNGEIGHRTVVDFDALIHAVVQQGLIDIMLMSAATNERLTIKERLFDNSHVTPAARANDTTDIWVVRDGVYPKEASRPFRSATIDHIQCGKLECAPHERALGANLGLYSVTFVNDLERDMETLREFKRFREEAERRGFRYFLEIFDPNVDSGIPAEKLGAFVNDNIVRSLAGVTERGRPVFLKMVYHGPKLTEELVNYDPSIPVGILGGSAGTTYDAFKLLGEAQKYGARVALFGRKINNAEHQLAFIEMLKRIVDGQISPEEAVRAYHGVLQNLGIRPHRSLEDDMQLSDTSMSYAAPASMVVKKKVGAPVAAVSDRRNGGARTTGGQRPPLQPAILAAEDVWPILPDGKPDLSRMTSLQRVAYFKARLNKKLGVKA
ncbi:MAG: hypothetical protein HZA91_09130 [Verrucomicrobia bacterium]|nr:hypothetical protein [Verrucomicrobiota bacterium]